MSPSKLAISWFNSSVEYDGANLCTSSAVCGGGLEALIREVGVPPELPLPGGFLYGDEFGRTVICGDTISLIDS